MILEINNHSWKGGFQYTVNDWDHNREKDSVNVLKIINVLKHPKFFDQDYSMKLSNTVNVYQDEKNAWV